MATSWITVLQLSDESESRWSNGCHLTQMIKMRHEDDILHQYGPNWADIISRVQGMRNFRMQKYLRDLPPIHIKYIHTDLILYFSTYRYSIS